MALQAGIRPEGFWKMSLSELLDCINAFAEKYKRERKDRIYEMFVQAQVIAANVFPSKDKPLPSPWDYFPELFKEDRERHEEAQKMRQLEEYKAKRRAAVKRFNDARKRRKG